MPALVVSIDGCVFASVCCDDYDIVSVRVSGTLVDERFATLDMSGGLYPNEGNSTYLVWVDEKVLSPLQVVSVALLEDEITSQQGKTIEELFPDEEPMQKVEFQVTDGMFQELREKPLQRDGYELHLKSATGATCFGCTTSEEHGFGFTVLWHSQRYDKASLSLHSYTIDSMEHQTPMRNHFSEFLHLGQMASVSVGVLHRSNQTAT